MDDLRREGARKGEYAQIAALSMAGSSLLVALNALLLKRAKLPGVRSTGPGESVEGPRPVPAASPAGGAT